MMNRFLIRITLFAFLTAMTAGCSSGSSDDPDAGDSGAEKDGGGFNPDDYFAVDVACGYEHTCALTRSGKVVCWGKNHVGQLGDSQSLYEDWEKVTPIEEGAVAIEASFDNTCAVMKDGSLLCWGYNLYHQLGGDYNEYEGDEPVKVLNLDSEVVHVSIGDAHICAILADGTVSCWGDNSYGEVGDGVDLNQCVEAFDCLVPWASTVEGINDVLSIGAGGNSTCAVNSYGEVKCWGWWNGTDQPSSTPLLVPGLASDVVSVKQFDFVCSLLSDGKLMCWGENDYGELGDGTQEMSWTPVLVEGLEGQVLEYDLGLMHTCAILDNDLVYCWGNNERGALGTGQTGGISLVPAKVNGLADDKPVSICAGGNHTCSTFKDGSIRCWGKDNEGQLGADSEPLSCVEWDDCLFPTPVVVVGFGPDYMTPPEEE